MDQPVSKVDNPARGQLNRKNGYFPVNNILILYIYLVDAQSVECARV